MTAQYRTEEGKRKRAVRERRRREAVRVRQRNSAPVKYPDRIKTRDSATSRALCFGCGESIICDTDRDTRLINLDPKTREAHVCPR